MQWLIFYHIMPSADNSALQSVLETILRISITAIEKIGNLDVNYTVVVSVESRRKYLVKVMCREPFELEHRRFEATAVIFEKLHAKGIRVPQVEYVDSLIRQIGDVTTYGVLVMEFVNMVPLDTKWKSYTTAEKYEFAELLGNMIKRVHRIELAGFGKAGFFPELQQINWQQYFTQSARMAVDRLQNLQRGNQMLMQAAEKLLLKHADLWKYDGKPMLTHGDLWFGNVLVNANNHTDFMLIDWE